MATWAVGLARGGAWNPQLGLREQELWDEHAAFMDDLVDAGFVRLGGVLWGGAGAALLVVEAESEREIEERLARDPWHERDLLRIAEISRWEILLGGLPQ